MSHMHGPNQQLPPPGWYADPVGTGLQRYWDGQVWTQQTQPGTPPQWQFEEEPRAPIGYTGRGPRTADGVPLSGWWLRAWATLLDGLVVGVLGMLAGAPLWSRLQAGFQAWFRDAWVAAQTGAAMPDYTDPSYGFIGPYATFYAIVIGVHVLYSVALQVWKGGTLGMLALGLRVVPDGRGQAHHGLPLMTAVIRNVVYQLSSMVWVVLVISCLLPLAHPKRQTLHDIVARTQVVRIR